MSFEKWQEFLTTWARDEISVTQYATKDYDYAGLPRKIFASGADVHEEMKAEKTFTGCLWSMFHLISVNIASRYDANRGGITS